MELQLLDHIFHLYDFKPIEKDNFTVLYYQPKGVGLWTSTYSKKYGSDWIRWCVGEKFKEFTKKSLMTLIIPDDDAKIFTIDSLDDLKYLIDRFPEKVPKMPYLTSFDFYELSKWYDAIHLTEKGQWETRFSQPSLYGWDCESTLWFRMKFKIYKYIKFKKKWKK